MSWRVATICSSRRRTFNATSCCGMYPGETDTGKYVPTVVHDWLAYAPDEQVRADEGTVVFVDLSGFTRLSERLARRGREGAENLDSVRFASHAAKHSKSRVTSEPDANGTPSARASCSGQTSRRRRQWISSRQVPRSRWRQTESTGRVSLRALVEYPHSGQSRRRRRQGNLDNHSIWFEPNLLDPHALQVLQVQKPGRCRSDAHVALLAGRLTFDSQQPARAGGGASAPSRNLRGFPEPRQTPLRSAIGLSP